MEANGLTPATIPYGALPTDTDPSAPAATLGRAEAAGDDEKLRQTFHQMLGESLFRMAVKQMRSSVGSGGLFSTGAASEIVYGLFDEHVADLMAQTQPRSFSEGYFQQFKSMRQIGSSQGATPAAAPEPAPQKDTTP